MTLKQFLNQAREILTARSIEHSSLESELLLRETLKISRVQLYQGLDRKLGPEQEKTFWKLVKRRLNGEPTAYITEHREFYGLDFYVDYRVLIPRPESELLVETTLHMAENRPSTTIADIGTGCGAIAISLALSLPKAKIYATDISAAALKVTLFNCEKHDVADRISLLQGNMLDPLLEPVDIIIANLPYVRECELPRTSFEPRLALNGGSDGLEKIRQLSSQAGSKLRPDGCLLLEVGQGQAEVVTTFWRDLFPLAGIEVMPDLGGIDRVVSLTPITRAVSQSERLP